MQGHAQGAFALTREMLPARSLGGGIELMHVRFEKRFDGPLQARSVVEMLGYMTEIEGRAPMSHWSGWRARWTGAMAASCSAMPE